jgi:hypothetical protein
MKKVMVLSLAAAFVLLSAVPLLASCGDSRVTCCASEQDCQWAGVGIFCGIYTFGNCWRDWGCNPCDDRMKDSEGIKQLCNQKFPDCCKGHCFEFHTGPQF